MVLREEADSHLTSGTSGIVNVWNVWDCFQTSVESAGARASDKSGNNRLNETAAVYGVSSAGSRDPEAWGVRERRNLGALAEHRRVRIAERTKSEACPDGAERTSPKERVLVPVRVGDGSVIGRIIKYRAEADPDRRPSDRVGRSDRVRTGLHRGRRLRSWHRPSVHRTAPGSVATR